MQRQTKFTVAVLTSGLGKLEHHPTDRRRPSDKDARQNKQIELSPDPLRSEKALGSDRRGITAFEYALIAGVIAIAIIASITTIGTNLARTFNTLGPYVSTY